MSFIESARQCLFRLLVRETDTPEDVHIKIVGFPISAVMFVFSCFSLPAYLPGYTIALGISICMLALGGFCVGVLVNVASARRCMDCLLLVTTFGLWTMDLYNSTLSQSWRSWAFVVLLLDLSLVFGRPHIPFIIIPSTMIYLSLETAESIHRFGLYEIGYWGIDEGMSSCNCASPPCANPALRALAALGCVVSVFLIDFYLTSEFANGMRVQLRSIESSVAVSEEIAASLAEYDVDAADRVISESQNLPPKLRTSFLQLLSNLRSYKAYLPHSCLVKGSDQTDEETLVSRSESVMSPASPIRGSSFSPGYNNGADFITRELSRGISGIARRSTEVLGLHRSSNQSNGSVEEERVKRSLKMGRKRCRVSLAAANMTGYLTSQGDLEAEAHNVWIAEDIEQWCARVLEAKGVVDVMAGDRRYASFNARQGCAGHPTAAIEVLAARGAREGQWSGCVATGQAVCGDFGNESVLRFMVLGPTASMLHPLERVAAKWRAKVLADGEAYSSACFHWEGKLLAAMFFSKRGERPLRLFEMTNKRGRGDTGPEEWMYELENIEQSQYEEANKETEAAIKQQLDAQSQVEEVSSNRDEPVLVWTLKEVGMKPY